MTKKRYNTINAAQAKDLTMFFKQHNITVHENGRELYVDVNPEQEHLITEFLALQDAYDSGMAWFKLPRDKDKIAKFWELATFYNLQCLQDRSGIFNKKAMKVLLYGHQSHLGGFAREIKKI